jgi:TPR repeat protein
MCDLGRGLAKHYSEALTWYRTAAARGDAVAQNNLAMLFAAGQGVPKNDEEAARWFRKAAGQGVAGAQTNLGLLLAKGQGEAQDYVEAYKWFNLAAAQNHENAIKNRDLLAAEMTREQVADGQRRAAQFVATRGTDSRRSGDALVAPP